MNQITIPLNQGIFLIDLNIFHFFSIKADAWDHNPGNIPPGFSRMDSLPQEYYQVSSSHFHLDDTRWFMETFFNQNQLVDLKKLFDAMSFHLFLQAQTQFDPADPLERILLKISSIVLLRAYHYKWFINIDVLGLVGQFFSQLQLLWSARGNQNDREIIIWRSFYILNFTKALIANSKFLDKFTASYSSFCNPANRFYELDQSAHHNFQSNQEEFDFNEVMDVKALYFQFMDSNLFHDAVERFAQNYGKWPLVLPLDLNAIITRLKNLQYFFTDDNIGVVGICGANQILLSYNHLKSEPDINLRRARLFFQFSHEIGHALMRILFGNQMISPPRNNLVQDPNLEAGFSMEKMIFGQYNLAIWQIPWVQSTIFDQIAWTSHNTFFNQAQFAGFAQNYQYQRRSNFYASGLEPESVKTYPIE